MNWRALVFGCLVPLLVAAEDTTTPIIWVEFDVDPTPSRVKGETLDYPEICITLPEVTNRQNNRRPASDPQGNGLSGPGRLMRRDADGKVTTLFDCGALGRVCTPADPRLSPDGRLVAFTLYQGSEWARECNSGNRTIAGIDAGAGIAIHDLTTGATTEWPYMPGRHDVTPVFVNQDGRLRVMFSSDRAGEYPPAIPRVSVSGSLEYPNLQTHVAELDGSGVHRVGPNDFTAAYGGYQLRDGRVVYSCAQWTHDLPYRSEGVVYTNRVSTLLNMWWLCGSDPWGGSQESIFGAHYSGKAIHWTGQMSDGRILFGEYYRGNEQQGAGKIWAMSPQPFTIEGRPAAEWRSANDVMTPRDLVDTMPWARSEDAASYFDEQRQRYQGRVRDPFGLPNGELGFVWCRGTCNNQSGWNPDLMDAKIEHGPRGGYRVADPIGAEVGIYKLPADRIPSQDYVGDPVMLRDRRHVAEFGAIYGGPYRDVHGQAEPDRVAQPLSGDRACYLHIASQRSDTHSFDVLRGRWRWGHDDASGKLGKELPGVDDDDVASIRITRAIPNRTRQTNFAGRGRVDFSLPGYRAQILGEVPVETDGSARIEVPCDTPFVLSGVNRAGEAIKRDMMVQSLRPGTVLACGGCHLHNDRSPQPEFAGSVAAGKPARTLGDPRPVLEYGTHIAPILARRCAGCHGGAKPAAGIDFGAGERTRRMILEDFEQAFNPRPVAVHGEGEGYKGDKVYRLDRPLASWLVHGSFAAGSPLYWYFKGARADYRSNADSDADIDFDAAHPPVGATAEEIRTVRDWIDSGLLYVPGGRAERTIGLPGRRAAAAAPKANGFCAGEPSSGAGAGREDPYDGDTRHRQPAGFVTIPDQPVETGGGPAGGWALFQGKMTIAGESYFDPHGIDMAWSYSRSDPVPPKMRLLIRYHNSRTGKWERFPKEIYAPFMPRLGQLELRYADAEMYDGRWREWHAMGRDGVRYPVRRVAALIEFLRDRYPGRIDLDRGIVVWGNSMGGGGSTYQPMIMAEPWRQYIAYVSAGIGNPIPRTNSRHYISWPPDEGDTKALWDDIDIRLRAKKDPIVRGVHYRHRWSANDPNWLLGPMALLDLCEQERLACSSYWLQGGHSATEKGYKPVFGTFMQEDDPNMDVTVDRAHPAITGSTGNYPPTAAERMDIARFPRGHYNAGISWHHGRIVDSADEIVFPLKYRAHKDIGPGIPDQPRQIIMSVTPRRPRHFVLQDGETLRWEWGGGKLAGTAKVVGDTVTADGIPLVSGEPYKNLRFFR